MNENAMKPAAAKGIRPATRALFQPVTRMDDVLCRMVDLLEDISGQLGQILGNGQEPEASK